MTYDGVYDMIETIAKVSEDEQGEDAAAAPDAVNMTNMDVQALIHMAVTASITEASTHDEPLDGPHMQLENEHDAEADVAPTAVSVSSVNSLTQSAGTDEVPTADANELQVGQTTAPPRIAALQAVAWFDAKASKAEKAIDAVEETEAASPQAEVESMTQTLAAQTDLSDNPDADRSTPTPVMPQAETADVRQAAAAMMAAQPVNPATSEQSGEPSQSDDLLLQPARQPSPQWAAPIAPRIAAADAAAVNAQAPTASSANDKIVQSGAPALAGGANVKLTETGAVAVDKALKPQLADHSVTPDSDIRDIAEADLTGSSIALPQQALSAPRAYAGAQASATASANPQDADVLQVNAKSGDGEDANADASSNGPVKGEINIRELMKLGVTEATLTFEPPAAATQAAQADPVAPIVTADVATTAASTPQASTVATANVETNGERRSIADDIRLRALERMVVNAARNGTQILSIQLYPPGLGQVVLRLAMDGQRLRLATRASTTEAAETLRNMETDLRSALAGNGLQLTGFDVSEDGTNDEAPRRQQTVEPVVKTRSGRTDESFTVELNA